MQRYYLQGKSLLLRFCPCLKALFSHKFLWMSRSSIQRKLKILFLTRWYPNKTNIQLAVFIQKHAAAAARYCDVALLNIVGTEDQKDDYEISSANQNGFEEVIVYYRTVKPFFLAIDKARNFFRYLTAHKKGMKLINEKFGDHDITQAYIFMRPVLLAWWIKVIKNIPYVFSEQWSGYVTGQFEKKSFIEKTLARFVAKRASAITVVSEFLKDGMIKNGIKGNYSIIPNVIETNSEADVIKGNDGVIKILSVADLVDEIKNIKGTIKAVAEIVKKYPGIRFDIVGGGHDRDRLEQLAAELSLLNKTIFFHGMKTNREVYQYLHQCDFLIMNSRFETFSSICAEAMSCGKPVIATRCGGPDEFVIPETGILIQPGNNDELAGAIKNMIENFSNYNAEKIKNYAAGKFNASIIGQQFANLYKSILL